MIIHLNRLLRTLFAQHVTGLHINPDNSQDFEQRIGFAPPDADWRSRVLSLAHNSLNAFLVDMRENRKLHSNKRLRHVENGLATAIQLPRRIDFHYLISAWSPIDVDTPPDLEPALDEQALLYEVIDALMSHDPLNPTNIYEPDSPDLAPWEALVEHNHLPAAILDLPISVLPSGGFPKLVEFWGSMGNGSRWKPVVYLVVTLPVVRPIVEAGPVVTTRIIEHRIGDGTWRPEIALHFSGRDRSTSGEWIADALVELTNLDLRSTTDERGYFSIDQVTGGDHTLHVTAAGFEIYKDSVRIPAPIDDSEIVLQPQ